MAAAASKQIPYGVRFLLTFLEPICAMGGVIMTLLAPARYIDTTTRGSLVFDPSTQFIYTSQAGSWLYFAFVEAVVLRVLDDVKVWRWLCAGMLLSDILYCHSVAQAVGGWAIWIKLSDWTVEDWVVAITTLPFLVVRVLIVIGVWDARKQVKQA